ncbi:MAG: hypothetical protein ACU84Q_06775 [Gammaproteobacteria bacterium]
MKAFAYLLLLATLTMAGLYIFTDRDNELLSAFFGRELVQDDDDDDDDDAISVDAKQQLVQGSLTVRLSAETQTLAGIKTVLAENITLDAEDKAYASVIDLGRLIDQRSRFRNVQAGLEVSRTQMNSAAVILQRLQKLNAETTNISERELQQASASLQEQKAIFNAEQIKLDNIRAEMLQRWSPIITEMALQETSEIFDRLLKQEEYLVLLSLRPEQKLSSDSTFAYINRDDERSTARQAYVISPAPFSEMNLGGETYFLRTAADQLRIGMRLHVWLPGTGYSGTGIGIPNEAIVWYAGKAWAYVQIDEDTFSRRSLSESHKKPGGWLVNDNFAVGDRIVVSGAQTLLSEEFKWAIPDEDDD